MERNNRREWEELTDREQTTDLLRSLKANASNGLSLAGSLEELSPRHRDLVRAMDNIIFEIEKAALLEGIDPNHPSRY